MAHSVFLAFSFAALLNPAASLHWFGPPKSDSNSPTSTANWSPATTADLRGGADHGLRLEARARYPPNVCGWIGGQDSLPVTCSSFSSCAWNSDNNYVGCCATSNHACTFYTSCIDGNSPPQTAGDRSDVYTCKGTSACYRNTYPNSYYQWGCGKSDYATAVATTFAINGGSGPDALQIVITGNAPQPSPPPTVVSASTVISEKTVLSTVTAPAPPTSAAPTSGPITVKTNVASNGGDPTTVTADKTTTQVVTTSIEPKSSTTTPKTSQSSSPGASTPKTNTGTSTGQSQSTATGAQAGSSITTASASAAASPENPKSHKGAIIGGVVGGIALVLIILAIAFFIMRRRKASEKAGAYAPYAPAEQPTVWHM